MPAGSRGSVCIQLLAVLAMATLYEFQRRNRDDEGDEGSPRAK